MKDKQKVTQSGQVHSAKGTREGFFKVTCSQHFMKPGVNHANREQESTPDMGQGAMEALRDGLRDPSERDLHPGDDARGAIRHHKGLLAATRPRLGLAVIGRCWNISTGEWQGPIVHKTRFPSAPCSRLIRHFPSNRLFTL